MVTLPVDEMTEAINILRRQKYHIIGHHSAVKKCYWVHKAITKRAFCYKAKFYGIESHRCVQFSPAVLWCLNNCLHCWRYRPRGGISPLFPLNHLDDPDFLVEMAIKEHRRVISGYTRYPGVDKRVVAEAATPKHAAISLVGEPTLYHRLGELIEAFHERGLTTFLVTRGILPEMLANLSEEPTQLYVSLEAYDEASYITFNNPTSSELWKKTLTTLELLPSFTCPTVIRITLVKRLNMREEAVKAWAKLTEVAQPTFIEVKAYMHVGSSIMRLSREDMPSHQEVKLYAKKLAAETGYNIVSESVPSRVVLLSKLEGPYIRYGNPPISWYDEDSGGEESGEYGELEEAI